MEKRQLIALCACCFSLYGGMGVFVSIMPIYLPRLGADASLIGFFLAFAYLSLAISNVIAGRLSDLFQRRKLLLIGGSALAVPLSAVLGSITAVLPLILLTVALWFVTGVAMVMVDVLAGLSSASENRARTFGILSFSVSLGLLAGGLVSGWIADHWGYPALFALLGGLYAIVPLAGLLLRDHVVAHSAAEPAPNLRGVFANRTFRFIFFAAVLGEAANSVIFLSRPLIMNALHFDAAAITSASGFGGLITLPLPVLIGWLAGRVGRKVLLAACFVAPLLGLLVLMVSAANWHFWLTGAFGSIIGLRWVVVAALITDTFPKKSLGTALSLMSTTPWIGIVVGLSAGGVAIRGLTPTPTLLLAAGVSVAALLLLIPALVSPRQSDRSVVEEG